VLLPRLEYQKLDTNLTGKFTLCLAILIAVYKDGKMNGSTDAAAEMARRFRAN
jgi:hypothetical protein